MKTKLLYTILATTMLIATTLSSAEIIPIWNKVNEAGEIHDMEFLRGEEEFILLAGTAENSQIQIRQTMTGELVRSYPMTSFHQPKLAITPDSNRFVLVTGGTEKLGATIELRDINSFNLIKKDSLINTKDKISGKDLFYVFNEIVIDPIRPLAYVILERTNFTTTLPKDSTFVIVYNYETMQRVKDLTPIGFGAEYISQIAVSKDGKYLATLNDSKAYLKVWDLETYEEIRSVKLYDENLPNLDWWCESGEIKFSSVDDDLIYFSGKFPISKSAYNPNGFYKYKFSINNFIKVIPDFQPNGRFVLFDNEERVIVFSGGSLYFLNQLKQKVELIVEPKIEYPLGKKTIFAKKYGLFIGYSGSYLGSLKYDSQTSVVSGYEEEIVISPNPTNSFIHLTIPCQEPMINYQISSIDGVLVYQTTIANQSDNLQIDFSEYPIGIYFLTVNCNQQTKTFKVIKED